MKQETNNEMDLLLRRLGRRADVFVSDANGDVEHLDADELSAYAENVLPAAARARYTEHLAECARCRELVVQLSSSAGVMHVVETTQAFEPSALRKFLANLFAPMVMRWAVPALGLIVVAAIGFTVLRQRQRAGASIAQIAERPAPIGITGSPEPSQPAQGFLTDSADKPAAEGPNKSAVPESQPTAPVEVPAIAGRADTARDAVAKKEQVDQVASATPAPPAPAVSEERQREAETAARNEVRGQAANEPQPARTVPAAKVEDRKAAEVAPSSTSRSSGGFAAGVRPKLKQAEAEVDKDKNDSETRTVAGRQFRKRNGMWIDTAYDSSRGATSLTRGSEQYRALIADEPAIKTIADQLDGEIIVVWKGRAYRIR